MRSLRAFAPADAPTLAGFLRAEGISDDGMAFRDAPTFVLEEGGQVMGFVTLRMAHEIFPELVHLVVAREHRVLPRVRFLARALRRLVRDAGYPRLIVPAETAPIRRLVEYYFRAFPYALDDHLAYYLVTV